MRRVRPRLDCARYLPSIHMQQQVLERLAEDLLQAEQANRQCGPHETATHEENVRLSVISICTSPHRLGGGAFSEFLAVEFN